MRSLILILTLMWLIVLVGCSPSPEANKAVAEKYISAFNAGTPAPIEELLDPNVTLKPLGGRLPQEGSKRFIELVTADFSYLVQIKAEKWETTGDQVSAEVVLSSPKPGALAPTPAKFTWTIKNGKITSLVIDPK